MRSTRGKIMSRRQNDQSKKKADKLNLERFTLISVDWTAPITICEWIKLNITTQSPEKLREALECALEMTHELKRYNPLTKKMDAPLVEKKTIAGHRAALAKKIKKFPVDFIVEK